MPVICLEAMEFVETFSLLSSKFLAGEGIGKIAAEGIEEETEAVVEQRLEFSLEERIFDHIIHRTEGIARKIAQNWQNDNLNSAIDYFFIPVALTKIQKPFTEKKHQNDNFFLKQKYSSGYIRVFPDSAVFYYAETDYVTIDTNDGDIDYGHAKDNGFFGFPSYFFPRDKILYRTNQPNRQHQTTSKHESYSVGVGVRPIKTFKNHKADTLYTSGTPKTAYTVKDITLHNLSTPANRIVYNDSSAEKSKYTGNELRPEVSYTPNEPIPKMTLEPNQPEPGFSPKVNTGYKNQALSSAKYQSENANFPSIKSSKVFVEPNLERKIESINISSRQTIPDQAGYSIDSLTQLSNLRKTEISYDSLSQRFSSAVAYSDEKTANDNERAYVVNGKAVDGVYVAFEGKIKPKDVDSYLEFIKDVLIQQGYNVEIVTQTYFDTDKKEWAKGSKVVDKENPEMNYHVIINHRLPDYKNGQESPLKLRKPLADDYLKILRHRGDLPYIKSPEFQNEDPLKTEHCFTENKPKMKKAA